MRMTPRSSPVPQRGPVGGRLTTHRPVGLRRQADRDAGQPLVELAGPLDGPLLGLDDGEPAELAAGAGDDAAGEGAGERRVLLHEVLGEQGVDAVARGCR